VDEFAWRPRELARYLSLTDGAISHALKRGRELQQTEAYRRVVVALTSQSPQDPACKRSGT
jgi:hypothetical protein